MAASDENMTHALRGAAAEACCSTNAPFALGAYTRLIDEAVWPRSSPSARMPAACQMPANRSRSSLSAPQIVRRTSTVSAPSQLASRKQQRAIFLSFAPSAVPILPLREASTTEEAPFSPSHLPLTRPRPPVPPDSKWAPRGVTPAVFGMRMTTLPVLVPPWSVRKAARAFFSRLKICIGRPWSTPAAARAESSLSTLFIHGGQMAIALSSAITSYFAPVAVARWS
mmetsp:Transcript_33488/g.107770  ORF Transcript_33488/g.107770 Transcript_33488/m.107770 type:complete len:226 (+) Transcript_33488:432-1109(+)